MERKLYRAKPYFKHFKQREIRIKLKYFPPWITWGGNGRKEAKQQGSDKKSGKSSDFQHMNR